MRRQRKISSLYNPKYINNDSANYIRSAISTEQEEIVPFDVEHKMIKFGEVIVSTHSIPVVLSMSDVCNKEYMKEWNKDAGRFFCTDLKRGNKNLYYEITTSLVRALVRQISPDEYKDDEFAKFEKVRLGEFDYAVIKVVNVDSDYTAEDINTCVLRDMSDDRLQMFEAEMDVNNEFSTESSDSGEEPIYMDESISTEFDFSDDDD